MAIMGSGVVVLENVQFVMWCFGWYRVDQPAIWRPRPRFLCESVNRGMVMRLEKYLERTGSWLFNLDFIDLGCLHAKITGKM